MTESKNRDNETDFYGFIPDLLDEISTIGQFHYSLNVVPDEKYGHKMKGSLSKWNGMIGELQNGVS